MEWGINLEFNKKKLNLNRKLIFYLALVMISVIIVMSLSINFMVENKFLTYISKINKESLERYNITYLKDLFIKDIRNMIISCNLLQIDKAKIGNLDNFRDTIDRLKEGGYITETSSHINVTDKGSLWVGNISYQFLDQKSKAKILQLYLDALRYKENPYNQDNMLVVS